MGTVVVESTNAVIQQETIREFISQESAATTVVTGLIGPRGIQGPQGVAGGASFSLIATIPIGGGRVVAYDPVTGLQYADPNIPEHKFNILGITESASIANTNTNVLRSGPLEDYSWNWTINNPIYLGANGVLIQTPPTVGFLQIVAIPVTATKIFVTIREPIVLV